jgi:hypothetical protein
MAGNWSETARADAKQNMTGQAPGQTALPCGRFNMLSYNEVDPDCEYASTAEVEPEPDYESIAEVIDDD